jgi:very-short-patch-repair endonuclease
MRDAKVIARARRLRKAATPTEDKLWQRLRDRRLGGLKFRRQADVGPHVVDFLCLEANLIVEVDGGIHDHPAVAARDAAREQALRARGFSVVRFGADAIAHDLETVLIALEQRCRR